MHDYPGGIPAPSSINDIDPGHYPVRGAPPAQRQIRIFTAPAVAHKYPDPPDRADGRTLIIGWKTNRLLCTIAGFYRL